MPIKTTVAALAAACIALLPLVTPDSADASKQPHAARQAARSTPAGEPLAGSRRLDVHGTVKTPTGQLMPHARMAVSLLNNKSGSHMLARTTSDGKARFHLRIPRTRVLTTFARRHSGQLNVLIWAKRGSIVRIRATSVHYSRRHSKSAIYDDPIGSTRMRLSQRVHRSKLPASCCGDPVALDPQWRTVATLSAARGMTAKFDYNENIETSYKVDLSPELKGWHSGGSVTVGSNISSGLGGVLDTPGREVYQIGIQPYRVMRCMAGHGFVVCWYAITASWNSDYRPVRAPRLDCGGLTEAYQRWYSPAKAKVTFHKTEGKSLTTTAGVGIAGVGLTLSTANSESNWHSWTIPSRAHTGLASFCLGGVDDEWRHASDVVTQAVAPQQPCKQCRLH